MDKLEKIAADMSEYDDDSKVFFQSLRLTDKNLGMLNDMKRTEGWKLMEKKIREELRDRIDELVKDDGKVQALIAILHVADTKTAQKLLQEEIDRILPDE